MLKDLGKIGFGKSYVVPAFWIFAIPVASLFFFRHAETTFDDKFIQGFVAEIQGDTDIPAADRPKAMEFAQKLKVSRMLASDDPIAQRFAEGLPGDLKFHYATFRWMIRGALFCIVTGVALPVFLAVCVLLSRASQRAQYLSLLAGWHSLRVFASLQVIAQASMAVALSFWVTALFTNRYYVKLIVIVGLLALCAVAAILKAIFKRIDMTFGVEGVALDRSAAPKFWADVDRLCEAVGTAPPAQIVAGIDAQFFVTENPLRTPEAAYGGRTLFVSLSLLRIMPEGEASAVLAHEMAHFSGQDTYYSKKISPLLARYYHYLKALSDNPISLPVFYVSLLFRMLFEASIQAQSRVREFRADRIAAEIVAPVDLAAALVRITAYDEYHNKTENEIIESNETDSDLAGRLKTGFDDFAAHYHEGRTLLESTTTHPFDSHPPLGQRIEALGLAPSPEFLREALDEPTDEAWYRKIDGVEEIESRQWDAYQARFKQNHELILACRTVPETDEQRAFVESHFPPRKFDLPKQELGQVDIDGIISTTWETPLGFEDIHSIKAEKDFLGRPILTITPKSTPKATRTLPMPSDQAAQAELCNVINQYMGRYYMAQEYRKSKAEGPTA